MQQGQMALAKYKRIFTYLAENFSRLINSRYEQLMKIRGRRKLLLTGTPLRNNLVELMSLLIFVMPGMFAKRKEQLKKMFSLFPKTQDESERWGKELSVIW